MALQWNQDLSVGVYEIDSQHQELFRRVNQLLDAMSHGKGRDEIGSVIKFLGDYVVTHFGSEEAQMLKHSYPDYSVHKVQHDRFVKDFMNIESEIMTQGSTVTSVIKIQRWLSDWLVNHISKTDKAFGSFLNSVK